MMMLLLLLLLTLRRDCSRMIFGILVHDNEKRLPCQFKYSPYTFKLVIVVTKSAPDLLKTELTLHVVNL